MIPVEECMSNFLLKHLNRNARSRRGKPEEILKILNVAKGESVADIGAGGGYFTLEFARRVGPKGKVYAVDIRLKTLDFIRNQAVKAGLANVVPVLVRSDDFLLPDGGIDLVFLRNVYHHLDRPVSYFQKLRPHLRKSGRVAVIDYKKGMNWISLLGHSVNREQLIQNMKMAGYRMVRSYDILRAQSFHVFQAE
jgi:ubiquinone/menaquinone biosynthesis C-methylase UbiE